MLLITSIAPRRGDVHSRVKVLRLEAENDQEQEFLSAMSRTIGTHNRIMVEADNGIFQLWYEGKPKEAGAK